MPRTGAGTTGLGKPLKSTLRGAANVPIYTAATSEAGLRCAGEVADGVLLVWLDPDQADTAITPFVHAGRQRSRHHRGAGFATLAPVTTTIDADLERARGPTKRQLALYLGGMGARAKNLYTDDAGGSGSVTPQPEFRTCFWPAGRPLLRRRCRTRWWTRCTWWVRPSASRIGWPAGGRQPAPGT